MQNVDVNLQAIYNKNMQELRTFKREVQSRASGPMRVSVHPKWRLHSPAGAKPLHLENCVIPEPMHD